MMVRSGFLSDGCRVSTIVVGPLSNRCINELLEAGLVHVALNLHLTCLRLQVELAAVVLSQLPRSHRSRWVMGEAGRELRVRQ